MAISQTKYINIISGVGGQPAVSQRDLIGRVFTNNALVPTGAVVEFSGGATAALKSVGDYFGTTSAEYAFASKYFGFVSKKATQASKISFARYASVATGATVYGIKDVALNACQSETDGDLTFELNGEAKTVNSVNLFSATDLANVATSVTTALTTADIDCSVEYDATNARFVLKTTETGAGNTLSACKGSLATLFGWDELNAIISDGVDAATPALTVAESAEVSNNFYSFCFLTELQANDLQAIAEWVQAQNVRYMFSITTTPANANAVVTAVKGYNGVGVTLDAFNATAGYMPMTAIAAIDWTRSGAAINMMYQQFPGVNPSVTTDADSNKYDKLKVNYYGVTQQAGQPVSFYQNGVLQGEISDMGVYANEAWLKDSLFTNLLNLRLALDTLPATSVGKALVLSTMMDSINQALFNGVITVGKTLDATQKAYITQLSGDADAWMNIQSSGYWVTANVEKYTEDGVEKYKINYLLIYSKGDSVNFIDGSDVLI